MLPSSTPSDAGPSLVLIEAGLTSMVSLGACLAARWFILVSAHRTFCEQIGAAQRPDCSDRWLIRAAVAPCQFFLLAPFPCHSSRTISAFCLRPTLLSHGRLANPTPAMWTHFESIHIAMHPTYMSMYFPGPGLVSGRQARFCSAAPGLAF